MALEVGHEPTTHSNPEAERRHQCPPLAGDRMRTASGSTSDSRLADLLARLADLDAIGASRIRAWDRLHERRSA